MTTVYLIRHAEAEGNTYRRCQGQYDSLLTPRAYKQLPYLAKRFASVPLDAVYSSDLFRAWRTAQAVAEPHGLTVQLRPVLREINMGDWEDIPWAELTRGWPEAYALWKTRPWDSTPPHGESVIGAGARLLEGVRGLVRENPGKTLAVCTHGSAIRGALTLAHGFRPEQMAEIGWGDNTCVAKLECNENGGICVVYENDASHLPVELSTFAAIGWKDDKGVPVTLQIGFRPVNPDSPEDADKLVGFMRELHRNAYGSDCALNPAELMESVRAARRVSPDAVTFGYLESGEDVALVYLKAQYTAEPGIGLVGGFCLDAAYRGSGLSQQMLGQAVSVYRALGKVDLCAHVAQHNERAKGFYRKMGFVQRGEYLDANGKHLRMFKRIAIPTFGESEGRRDI